MIDYEELLEDTATRIEDLLALIRNNRLVYAEDLEEELEEMKEKINAALGLND